MSTDLTTIFGTEIIVAHQPYQPVRQYSGYPGAHGLTALHLGTRGYPLAIVGTLRASGFTYALARAALQAAIYAVNTYILAGADDYTFMGVTYANAVFESLELLPDGTGKVYHYNAGGYCTCRFRCLLRGLT